MKKLELRKQIILGVLSLVYALCLVLGHDIMNYDTIEYGNAIVWIRVVIWIFVCDVCLNIGCIICSTIWEKIGYKICTKYFLISDRKFYWIVLGTIIVFWMPTYIACWPGLGIYDGPCQLGLVTTHHPFLHTLFIHACNSLAEILQWRSWLVPYSFLQMCILAGSFAYAILCLKRWHFPKIYIYIMMGWICIFPMNSLMAITSTKDTLFSALFLLMICELGKMRYSGDDYWTERCNCIRYCIVCFLMCALRNNGVYVLIGTVPFLLIFMKKYWKKIILLSMAVIMGYFLYSEPLMNVMGIPQGDKREALTVIIQPLARTYRFRQEELSQEDKAAIRKLFGGGEPWYVSHISDAPKSQFDSEVFFDDLGWSLGLYVKLGLRYPDVYLDALLANTYGNWYPHEILPDRTAYRMYFEFPDTSAYEYESKFPGYYEFLQRLSRESIYLHVPFLYVFFCTGIVVWILLFLFGVIITRKEYDKIIYFIPFIVLLITIMLGPVALLRYTYPLMVGLILLVALVYSKDLKYIK